LHVHVDVNDFSEEDVAKVVAFWMLIEPVLFSCVPKHRSRSIFCKMLRRRHLKNISSKDAFGFYQNIKPFDYNSNRDRRVSLNICNFERSLSEPGFKRKTLEFRLPEMSPSADEIRNWVRFFVIFVENTKELPMPIDMSGADLFNTLRIVGLHPYGGEGLILSDGLFRTKEWFLYRILKYATSKKLRVDAITMLNDMWYPLRQFDKGLV
jgi:hypothetical protein